MLTLAIKSCKLPWRQYLPPGLIQCLSPKLSSTSSRITGSTVIREPLKCEHPLVAQWINTSASDSEQQSSQNDCSLASVDAAVVLIQTECPGLEFGAQHISNIVALLSGGKASNLETIANFLTSHPKLFDKHFDEWDVCLRELQSNGFRLKAILSMMSSVRGDIFDNISILPQIMNEMRAVGLSSKSCIRILETHPNLVNANTCGLINRCFSNLSELMPRAECSLLIARSPQIIFEKWINITEKYNYVVSEMGIEYKDMLRSSLFDYTFEHVRTRHLFLQRLGFYEHPNYKGETKFIKNIPLGKIIDGNDRSFAAGRGMKLEDYNTFRNLLQVEDELAGSGDTAGDDDVEDGGDSDSEGDVGDSDGDYDASHVFRQTEHGEQLMKRRKKPRRKFRL